MDRELLVLILEIGHWKLTYSRGTRELEAHRIQGPINVHPVLSSTLSTSPASAPPATLRIAQSTGSIELLLCFELLNLVEPSFWRYMVMLWDRAPQKSSCLSVVMANPSSPIARIDSNKIPQYAELLGTLRLDTDFGPFPLMRRPRV